MEEAIAHDEGFLRLRICLSLQRRQLDARFALGVESVNGGIFISMDFGVV